MARDERLTASVEQGDIQTLRATVQQYCSPEDCALIERAYAYATQAHAGKTRYSGDPYIVHPVGAAQRLADMRVSAPMVAAGLLHDVIEDADCSPEDVRARFGSEIAQLVEGVTKSGTVRFQGEQRYIENLRKMFVAMAKDIRVIIIKFCDRLHNLETLRYVPEPKRLRIARESLEIHAPIANRLNMYELKAQLEDLAFPCLYPEDAAWVETVIANRYSDRKCRICNDLKRILEEELQRQRIPYIHVEGRMKHRFGLYQKLLRFNRDITQIYDHVALRVIVPDVADCYAVLGLIHQRWQPLKGRIKDYIANPKPNGYQSLHTTVSVDQDDVVEFQIRTESMHEEAEWGAAAAWRYHERGTYRPPEHQLKWVEDLIRWQRSIDDPKDFLAGLKFEILPNRILVFTPKGDVIELPEGATPLDFAYAIHTDVGNHATGARINGARVLHPLDQPLGNGDLIEIIIDPRRAGPSADWLRAVKTTLARSKIRDALRTQHALTTAQWAQEATSTKRKHREPESNRRR